MQDFCGQHPSRFPGLPPAPFGEWKGLAARLSGPFDPDFAAVSPIIGKLYAELPSRRDRAGERYLPIEALRDEAVGATLHDGAKVARTFRSSGTTRETRSLVRFSPAGLECYRQESLYTFFHVLAEVLGTDLDGLKKTVGLSLVPTVTEWPDSSLAQMVAWIAEVVPVRYVTEETFAASVHEAGDKPIWTFGTAFHWVNLLDLHTAAGTITLPRGSVVFETGGTKGKSREITRDDLYAEITAKLGVVDESIVSEYGMCELAAQAYDFRRPGETGPRRFRFPAWVEARVITSPGIAERFGQGALLVEDPLRVDAPWALRTEDLVNLNADGFTLLGRIPTAPLKGCSLLAEAVVDSSHLRSPASGDRSRATLKGSAGREGIHAALNDFIKDDSSLDALTKELGSAAAARAALVDITKGMPKSDDDWRAAAQRSMGDEPVPKRWLFVLPESHSIVGLYPIALAYVIGLDVTVRVPKRLANDSLLTKFIDRVRRLPDARIATRPDDFKIVDANHDYDAILAYGEDATIAKISAAAGVPVQGFGGRFAMSLVSATELATSANGIAKDAFSLGQTGCLSTRLLMVTGSEGLAEAHVAKLLADAGRSFWQAALPTAARIGFDLDAWRLARLGFTPHVDDRDDAPLIATRRCSLEELTPEFIERVISQRHFTLPVIMMDANANSIADLFVKTALAPIAMSSSLSCLTVGPSFSLTKSDYEGLSFRALGDGNTPTWDGCHEGRPLFGSTNLR